MPKRRDASNDPSSNDSQTAGDSPGRFSGQNSPISFDPYIVWRTLVLANPDMMLFVSEKSDLSGDPSIIDFARAIAIFPDDLQDVLFIFAQNHGVAAAHRALDQAVDTAFRIEREAWLNESPKADPQPNATRKTPALVESAPEALALRACDAA